MRAALQLFNFHDIKFHGQWRHSNFAFHEVYLLFHESKPSILAFTYRGGGPEAALYFRSNKSRSFNGAIALRFAASLSHA